MHQIDKTKLSDQTNLRLYEIKNIENYFINVINERKLYGKKLNKYVTIFDYIDKILIILSATLAEYQLFHYKCYWNISWNSKCKFCFNFFFINRNH